MKLLVTGGAGFVGSHFVRSVLADTLPGLEGARVTVLDNLGYAGGLANLGPVAEHERLDFLAGDAGDEALVGYAMRDVDAVLHAAPVTADATRVLLAAAVRRGEPRFVQVSTDEVYGPIDTGGWTESSPLAPRTPEAATTAGADLLALAYHHTHGLPVVVARAAHAFGPGQHPSRPVPRKITARLLGRSPADELAGRGHHDGTAPDSGRGHHDRTVPDADRVARDWLHVDDLCRGLALTLTDGKAGEIYHIGGVIELSPGDIAGLLPEITGDDVPDDVPAAAPPRARFVLDDDKIRHDLGHQPRVEFMSGLAATVQWYTDHEDRWRPLLET